MPVLVPYHQDEYLPGFVQELPRAWADRTVVAGLPADATGWARLVPLYRAVAEAVAGNIAAGGTPTVVASGCCGVSLGVLAGLQRAGIDAGVVWFDAHGDVQTMETSASGYLGGMPVRIIVGYRPELVADAIGLRAIPEERVTLVDARDLDPPEVHYLEGAAIRHSTVEELDEPVLPSGPLMLHIDLDVVDPADMPGLRFPVPDGLSSASVVAAVRRVLRTGRAVALDIAGTWDPSTTDPSGARSSILNQLLA